LIKENSLIKLKQFDKQTKRRIIINIILTVIFITLAVSAATIYGPKIMKLADSPQELKDLLNSFGWRGVIVFIAIQTFQVIVAVIPGEIIQIAGGYIYGAWAGTLFSIVGIFTGSVVVFFISKFLGYSIIKEFISPDTLEKFNFRMNSDRAEIAMFILFLLPGIPKDLLTYIAGLTPVRPLRFFVVILVARLPALFASCYIGYSTQQGNYLVVIILSVITLILFVVGLLNKDRIIRHLNRSK